MDQRKTKAAGKIRRFFSPWSIRSILTQEW
jgi:hypothetical protein